MYPVLGIIIVPGLSWRIIPQMMNDAANISMAPAQGRHTQLGKCKLQ